MVAEHVVSAGLWFLFAAGFVLSRGELLLGAFGLLMGLVYVGLAWRGPVTPGIALNLLRIPAGVALAVLVLGQFGLVAVGLLAVATQLATVLVRRGLRRRADLS